MEADLEGWGAGDHMRYLNVGSGAVDRKGDDWFHLDSREVSNVDFVQDALDTGNFQDESWNGIYSKDFIEHISWRDVEFLLKEWHRMLVPGGWVKISTPNAEQLASIILGAPHQKTRCSGESDWMYFSRVAYGHQDYPENTHKCYFTPGWLSKIVEDAGFHKVRSEDGKWWNFTVMGFK